jgi:hypothetical protein
MSHAFQRGQIRRRNVYTHSSATALSLTEEQSGSLIFLDCSPRNLVVNLPPIAGSAGLNYEFLISDSFGSRTIIIHAKDKSSDAEAKLKIKQNHAALQLHLDADPNTNKVVTLTVNGTPQIGDKFEVVSDGSYWYFNVLESSITPVLAAS